MKTLQKLTAEISKVIRELETDYPEVYRFLDESPVKLNGSNNSPTISTKMLEDYLETLKELIKHYKETHSADGAILKS